VRNAPDSSVQSIRRIDVYRLAEKPRAPRALTEDDFAARATLIGSVTYDQIRNAGENLTYHDSWNLPANQLDFVTRFASLMHRASALRFRTSC
jgi:hypothetical protein